MKNKQEEYVLEVSLGFTEKVKASSLTEAIKKLEDKYIRGKGRLPREWIYIDEHKLEWYQVED